MAGSLKKMKGVTSIAFIAFLVLIPFLVKADHLSNSQCYEYLDCILGKESAINKCYDNDFLQQLEQNRPMCIKIQQHKCKVKVGIQETGRQMTIAGPVTWYKRPVILDKEEGVEAHVDMPADIRIYNYAGWNHCPIQYQGLENFWCDPHQLRYPPEPWCDLRPTYNLSVSPPVGLFPDDQRFKLYKIRPLMKPESE